MRQPHKQLSGLMQRQPGVLAHVVETDETLVVTQSNASALRDLRNSFLILLGVPVSILWVSALIPGPPPLALFIFPALPGLWLVVRSINHLFGKETFVFDRSKGIFIRNGVTVGPLRKIRKVTAQVTRGLGQNPMFRLILELPRCQTVTVATTHYVPAQGDFELSRNGFGDPNKRFAIFEPWINYEEQTLVPFLPVEIAELQEKISNYIGK